MKKRLKATHFIEQYDCDGRYTFTPINVLQYLPESLAYTAKLPSLHTIAIFKIKFKQS